MWLKPNPCFSKHTTENQIAWPFSPMLPNQGKQLTS